MYLVAIIFLLTSSVFAGRPLITDDADVVGHRVFQLETWAFVDENSFQHWIVPTIGLGKFEINASAVHGTTLIGEEARTYTFSGPILQGKYQLQKHVAFSGGVIAPYGTGPFITETWDYFFYGAFSTVLMPDELALYLNVGQQTRRQSENPEPVMLWGVALEHRTFEKAHIFLETTNGDVIALNPGISTQTGLRYDYTETFQIDGTVGTGLTGEPKLPFWVTVGIKTVTDF